MIPADAVKNIPDVVDRISRREAKILEAAKAVARQNSIRRRNLGYSATGRIASRPCERFSSCSS